MREATLIARLYKSAGRKIPHNKNKRNSGKKAQFMDVPIEWDKIINKIRIDKNCSHAELVAVQRACFTVGINPVVKQYNFIGVMPNYEKLKDVEFDLFDINDMPGTRYITIE